MATWRSAPWAAPRAAGRGAPPVASPFRVTFPSRHNSVNRLGGHMRTRPPSLLTEWRRLGKGARGHESVTVTCLGSWGWARETTVAFSIYGVSRNSHQVRFPSTAFSINCVFYQLYHHSVFHQWSFPSMNCVFHQLRFPSTAFSINGIFRHPICTNVYTSWVTDK